MSVNDHIDTSLDQVRSSMASELSFVAGATHAPRNQWYVAAFSSEVNDKPIARQILGDHLVFFRTSEGVPVALTDRCAHRAATLSSGKLVGDSIQCFYHGLQYDQTGRCSRVPSQIAIPAQMKVRSYQLVEKWQWVWIWMGDAALADPSLIPDHSEFGLEDSSLFVEPFFRMEINGNYQLLHENLLDVSHISFLHEGSFDSGLICKTEPTVEVAGSRIRIERQVEEVMTGAYAATFEFAQGTRIRRILRSESWAPGLNVVTNLFWEIDKPNPPLLFTHAIFPITPKTDSSCHYFTATSKNYGLPVVPKQLKQAVWDIFLTDKAAIESIQSSYDLLGANTPDTSVRADGAALRYRRIITEMLAQEDEHPNPQSPFAAVAR